MAFIENFVVAVPTPDEQRMLVDLLGSRRRDYHAADDCLSSELALAHEHVRVVTDAAVKGHIDIRRCSVGAPTLTREDSTAEESDSFDVDDEEIDALAVVNDDAD
jgi:hypothetical protein